MLPTHRAYLVAALLGTPDVLDGLLAILRPDDPTWDNRPDPNRFTLREMVAHVADWEPIHLDRLSRTLAENVPVLPSYDEGQIALDHDYAHTAPHSSLIRFRDGRAKLVAFLQARANAEWEREADRQDLGRCSIEAMATVALAHDCYHIRQAIQWLAASQGKR